jgi:type VI secretion system protein ImpC
MRQTSQVAVTLEIEPQAKPRRAVVSDEPGFRILVLADFGGDQTVAAGRPVRIDRDDFDAVLERMAPRAVLGIGDAGTAAVAHFSDIDDFHPDRLIETLPLFARLRELRDRLDDPRTFEAAARELLQGTDDRDDDVASDPAAEPAIDPSRPAPSGGNGGGPGAGSLLDRMLDETVGPAPASPPSAGGSARRPPDDLQAFIREAVAPHLAPGEDPRRGPLVERIEAATGDLMRRVLRDPAFRAIESAWRALFRMTRAIETSGRLTIDAVDMPRAALESDVMADRPLETTVLHRVLVDEPAEPWSVVIGDYTFGTGDDDIALLSRIATIAGAAGASFIANADATVCGCPAFEGLPDPAQWTPVESKAWRELRASPHARHIGLVQPRLMARLPYGRDGEETERFEFEELSDPPVHDEYLWGGGACVCAILLARSFTQDGPAMRPGTHLDLDGLPLHLVRSAGSVDAQPCAESLMSERAAARILECGPMPLASMKGSDAVRLVRFQSVAEPVAPLAGLWTG